ncbi:MAG: HTTM domain-containing protein [Cryomorphaceae bacterium]|nr:HTTM domain-containing protein [Cryomorphaceae bacterium]
MITFVIMLNRLFFKPIDNAALVIFRWLFGLLIFLESVGAIFTGWVRVNMVEPTFSFTFIGFEWMNVLLGPQMYIYYTVMGVFGLMVMVGWRYRLAMVAFTLMWTGTYLMQKTSYNNHYYLLVLVSFIMCLLPAHHFASVDVKTGRVRSRHHMYNWHRWSLILMMTIAYVYGSVAKIYPDWLDATFIRRAFTNRYQTPWLNELFSQSGFHYFISYTGILFDMFIVPALLWRRTRTIAVVASFVFHLFNSAVFQIGIFPYMSLAFILFFYPPDYIRRRFLSSKPPSLMRRVQLPKRAVLVKGFVLVFFAVQLVLPLRHYWIDSNVFWSEEGHRMSWRMMLRSKSGYVTFYTVDKNTEERKSVQLSAHLTAKQVRGLATHPDMIWQFAQYLHRINEKEGLDVAVYADARVSLNGRPKVPLIDSNVDLAGVQWQHFSANPWITDFSFE